MDTIVINNALAERINDIFKQKFLAETCKNKRDLEILVKQPIKIYTS